MAKRKQVPLMLSIPKEYRDKLRPMAARKNLENADKVTSASQIGREIICAFLDKHDSESGTDL